MPTASDYKDQGNAAFLNKQYKKAAKIYRDGIKHDRTNPVLFSNRAQCFIHLGDWDRVLRDTEEGLMLDPEVSIRAKLLFRRGIAFKNLKDPGQAEKCFRKVIGIAPTNDAARTELSNIMSNKKAKLESPSTEIPLEVVDELPSEFANIVDPPKSIPIKSQPSSNLVDLTADELFGHKKAPLEKAIPSPVQETNFSERPSMHYLKTLALLPPAQKSKAYHLVLNMNNSSLLELFETTGIDAEFFEFFVEAAAYSLGDFNPQGILQKFQFLSTLKRYDIASQLCSEELKMLLLLRVGSTLPELSTSFQRVL